MSEKFYTPDQVAKEVLRKYHSLAKALVDEQAKAPAPESQEVKVEAEAKVEKAEVEKCGEMKKDETTKNPKLKEFLDKKKAKKTSKMEKMLGMNSGMAPAAQASTPAPSTPSIATQIGWPGTKK